MEVVKYIFIEANADYTGVPYATPYVEEVVLKKNQHVKDALNEVIGKRIGAVLHHMEDERYNFQQNHLEYPDVSYDEFVQEYHGTFSIVFLNSNGQFENHVINKHAIMLYAEQEFKSIERRDHDDDYDPSEEQYGFTLTMLKYVPLKNFKENVLREVKDSMEDGEFENKLKEMIDSIYVCVFPNQFASSFYKHLHETVEKVVNVMFNVEKEFVTVVYDAIVRNVELKACVVGNGFKGVGSDGQ